MIRHWIAVFLAAWTVCLAAGALEAGAGRAEITPPIGTPLNGYGDRMGRSSTGVHDSLWARALFLDDGTTRLFLIDVDLVAINPELRARVLELASDIVPHENIILCATHTHNGQGGMTRNLVMRAVSGRFIPEVLESTAIGITQSMQQAYDNRRRAAIGYGTAKQTALTANRRVSGGPRDEQIGVIMVEDADGKPISVVANLAGHPTTIGDGPEHYEFSADYPGYYYKEMEALTSPDCVALFLNGAEGNQTVGDPEGKSGWARTESIGRSLARRVKEVINGISCGEATLKVNSAEPKLPLTLASQLQPDKVFVQTLEINDLLLTFLPGEPCAEIALELRNRALARGYAAQFTVGLANDYIMYFTPKSLYSEFTYEASSSFFGPRMEDWFYREFTRLMSKGEPLPDPPMAEPAQPQEIKGGMLLDLKGDPYAVGVARGRAFQEDLKLRYDNRIFQPVSTGAWYPPDSIWAKLPKFVDPTMLLVPMMGMAARPLLKGVPDSAFREIEGLAEGAGMPFDAMWLLQNATTFSALENKTPLFATPLCTMFATAGVRAGADDLLVARNLDWAFDEQPVVTKVTPTDGHKYVQVGFTWNAGVFTGMNDAGLTVCVERMPGAAAPALQGPPIEMVLRDLLQTKDKFEPALAMLAEQQHVRGVHVLLAGFEGKASKPVAAVVEYGSTVAVRRMEKEGVLTGTDPASASADTAARSRYGRVLAMTSEKRIVGDREMQRILGDKESGKEGLSTVFNSQTRHSVVFVPKSGKMYAAFPDKDGAPGPYNTISVKE
jgi:hypothetical protein